MSIALLFSGQGAQAVGMGRSLYENSAAAKACYDQADQILGWELSKICFEGPEEKLTETRVCQPALFVMGCAIDAALRERGFYEQPQAALGLSLGELTALTVAGAYTFEDGLKVVAERGRLMQLACDQTRGGMASMIGGPVEEVQELCRAFDVDMANLNCPGQIVISGDADRIDHAVAAAKESGKFRMVVPLKVAGAYHSRLMEPARQAFAAFIAEVPLKAPEIPVFTNTTGKTVQEPAAIREALARQVVSSVLWEDCMRNAAALGIETFYECGPGAVLAGLARRTDKNIRVVSISEFDHLPS